MGAKIDRPILYSAPMVRACRAYLKTETRRARGLKRINEAPGEWECLGELYGIPRGQFDFQHKETGEVITVRSPYGVSGDGLWHREAYRASACYNDLPPSEVPEGSPIWYEADSTPAIVGARFGKLRPGMFMCRWMSRDSSVVVRSYPERLHEITEEGAKAEGALFHDGMGVGHSGWRHDRDHGTVYVNARTSYFHLWDSVNGLGAAAKNEWVWVTKFSMVA